ncbi:MAG: hypothetical protein QOF21_239 [Actinomycetota bacterium]|jgi:hypothetical protein
MKQPPTAWRFGGGTLLLLGLVFGGCAAKETDSSGSTGIPTTHEVVDLNQVRQTTTTEATASTVPPTVATNPPPAPPPPVATTSPKDAPAPSAYYENCDAARRAGAAPLHRGDPGYRAGLDRDNDGVACE